MSFVAPSLTLGTLVGTSNAAIAASSTILLSSGNTVTVTAGSGLYLGTVGSPLPLLSINGLFV